jgi:hypothetical protein
VTDKPDDWSGLWDARKHALQELLGPTTDRVFHAVTPLELGGQADVVEFPDFVSGATYVTCDLTGPQSSQLPSSLGQYELMICTRSGERWAPNLISRLAPYTFEAVLEPSETMDIGSALPKGSSIAALLFTEPPLARNEFQVLGHRCGLLLCLGITAAELQASLEGRGASLLEALKREGVFPFTDLQRASVL